MLRCDLAKDLRFFHPATLNERLRDRPAQKGLSQVSCQCADLDTEQSLRTRRIGGFFRNGFVWREMMPDPRLGSTPDLFPALTRLRRARFGHLSYASTGGRELFVRRATAL